MIGYSISVKLNELKLIHEEQISKYNDKIITIWEDNAKCIVLCMLYNKTQKYYIIFKNTYKCTCKCVQKIKNILSSKYYFSVLMISGLFPVISTQLTENKLLC